MKLQLVSNTVTQVFNKLPAALDKFGNWELAHSDLAQISQFLMSADNADVAVILLDFDYFIETYPDASSWESLDALEQQIRQFRANNSTKLLVSNLIMPPYALHFHQADTDVARQTVMEMNVRISRMAAEIPDLAVLDLFGVALETGSENFYRAKNKFVFQSPYSPAAVGRISALIAERVHQIYSARKKVCVLDADNTLWGGVLGEDGPEGIQVDNNYPGIIYKTFQQQLLKLKASGIVLAMVTKNNEQDVLDLFKQRNMPLALSDFTIVKANWERKSQSIAQIAQELNLGLSSFVFIDDSQFEIDEVGHTLPEVECVRFDPNTFLTGKGVLASVHLLNALRITEEDRAKSEQYRAEQSRQAARTSFQSIEEYIGSLDIAIICGVNNEQHLSRVTQLINKTNQFNLTCERLSESDVLDLMRRGHVFDFHVRDKFGDMGIVGVMLVLDGQIRNFLLSCRVLGRKIEDKILAMVSRHPAASGGLQAIYRPGPKNMQVENLYDKLGFVPVDHLNDGGKLYRLEKMADDLGFIQFGYADAPDAA